MLFAIWISFAVLFLALLAVDLGFFNRRPRAMGVKEAFLWTLAWMGVASGFGAIVYFLFENHVAGLGLARPGAVVEGEDAAYQYFAAYITEKVLNLDILFVIAAIFANLRVPREHQHKVLFWGLVGVLFLRAGLILLGAQLMEWAEWLKYVFGVLLLLAAAKMMMIRFDRIEGQQGFVTRLLGKFSRVSQTYDGARFFTRVEGKRAVTPLFVALVMIEFSDVIFAIDTIPGVLAVTSEGGVQAPPFVLVTSNVFAVLGLRALYFVLEATIHRFHYLKTCLACILAFVGTKMLMSGWYDLSPEVSAAAILATLGVGIVASILDQRANRDAAAAPLGTDIERKARMALRQARRVVVLVIGSTILLLAIPIGALPGPGGILVAVLGLAILATEFVWAQVWLNRVKKGARAVQKRAFRFLRIGKRTSEPGPGAS